MPSIKKTPTLTWAVKINTLERQDFHELPLGDQHKHTIKVNEFKQRAKKVYIGAKGKATFTTVKKWIAAAHPQQYYACWKSDSPSYKDDSVELWYL